MIRVKDFLVSIFTLKFFQKILAYGLLILFIYLFSDFAFFFFLTFIFAYLFYSSADSIKSRLTKFINKRCSDKRKPLYKSLLKTNSIIILEYILFIIMMVLLLVSILPQISKEITELATKTSDLSSWLAKYFVENNIDVWFAEKTIDYINAEVSKLSDHIPDLLKQVKNASILFLQFIMSLILSLVILLDRQKLQNYLLWIKRSNFKFLYKEYKIIFEKVVKSFGLILKAQAMIALVNAILTTIWLSLIALVYFYFDASFPVFFPYILTLWLIVFVFGFVPVLGTFISSVPILIVAYSTYWGLQIVLFIAALIAFIHAVEAYILNPKIVSRFMNFPVSLTFLILIISEHTFGFAWLLIWVSLFYFLVSLFKDIDKSITKKRKIKKLETDILKRVEESELEKNNP